MEFLNKIFKKKKTEDDTLEDDILDINTSNATPKVKTCILAITSGPCAVIRNEDGCLEEHDIEGYEVDDDVESLVGAFLTYWTDEDGYDVGVITSE